MDFRDSLSAEMPAPRDDEPAGLRQEILDELADHLACSYNRERLRGASPDEARRRAFERFGDPAAVARRLWLDAMRGKIMTRRIVLATCLVVTLASLATAGVMWRQTAQSQRDSARAVAEAMRLMADQNEKARASQQELLKQLRDMSETIRSTRSLDWNPVTFRVTEETSDGPPAAGLSIALRERPTGGQNAAFPYAWPAVATRVTDRSGLVDFGVVHPGEYSFQTWKSWDQGAALASGQLRIEPGSQIRKRIVIPRVPLDRVPVRVRAAWPDDLVKEKLSLFASFTLNPVRRDDLSWRVTDVRPPESTSPPAQWWNAFQVPAMRSALHGPGPSLAELRPKWEPYVWAWSLAPPVRKLWADFRDRDLRELKEPGETIEWEQGSYRLSKILVLRPDQPGATAGMRRFAVLVVSETAPSAPNGMGAVLPVWNHPPREDNVQDPGTKSGPSTKRLRRDAQGGGPQQLFVQANQRFPQVDTDLYPSVESWPKEVTDFEARPGRVNEWTIPLPAELIEAIRKRLKPEPPPKEGNLQ